MTNSLNVHANKKVALVLILLSLAALCIVIIQTDRFGSFEFGSRMIVVPDDYPTIQAAIDNASEGDEIFVKNGTYRENLLISKSVSLKGESRNSTIIQGTGNATLLVRHDYVNISGFTIQSPVSLIYDYGVHLLSVKHCSVFDNSIEIAQTGVWLYDASFNNVFENIITENWSEGIYLDNSNNNTVAKNKITDNNYNGISSTNSQSNTIIENYVLDNGREGIFLGEGSSFNSVIANNVTENGDSGIQITSENNLIKGNSIRANLVGITLSGSFNTIIENVLENNKEGIGRGYGFYGTISANNVTFQNTIYRNNFINNTKQVHNEYEDNQYLYGHPSKNTWDNGVQGNYWSDYNGMDNNGDGIGDTPYIINPDNQDRYPLMSPFSNEENPNTTNTKPFSATLVAVSVALVVIIGAEILFYLGRRKNKSKTFARPALNRLS